MTISEHLDEFEGLPVKEYSTKEGISGAADHAIRVALDWDAYDGGESFADLFAAFTADEQATEVRGLIIGDWGGTAEGNASTSVVEALVSARDRLPQLRALFLGEMTMEECEISWIVQSDVSPLFQAFPDLAGLHVRGGEGLRLGKPRHHHLKKLVIETGGMRGEVVREVATAELPQLQHLELWLGDEGYGNDITESDLRTLLTDGPCGNLVYLGLRDDCHADSTVKLLAEVGLPPQVEHLDLSLGTLGDEGVEVLVGCEWLKQLKFLDMHFHYASEAAIEKLRGAVTELDAQFPQEPDEWNGEQHRYVAVAE